MKMLKDSFGRTFPYIRLSITDVCNFKCGYCLPNGYQKDKSDNRKFLSAEEIGRLAKGLSELGVCKIRLTGGEPTVRKDFFDIVKILKNKTGIKKTVITTNGYRLDKIADQLVASDLDGINISIDSLNRETFKKVTNHDRLPEILKGIEKLQQLNFKNIKINAVLLKGINDSEKDFNEWSGFIKNNEIDFRYIELMQTGDGLDYFKKYHVPAKIFVNYLNNNDWIIQTLGRNAGPSKNYINPSFKGKFGVIAPYSKNFCKSCNRLRITARGDLRLCLFGNTGISIRYLLQKDDQLNELKDLISKQLNFKKESHYLELGETGLMKNLKIVNNDQLKDWAENLFKKNSFNMVDVSSKKETFRRALASGKIYVGEKVFNMIKNSEMPKGDPISLAEVSAVLGVKKTSELIPLCHPLPIDHTATKIIMNDEDFSLEVFCVVSAIAKTGVEMEAIMGVNAALITIYDLSKIVNPHLKIDNVKLLIKEGGKSGVWTNPDGLPKFLDNIF